MGELKDIRWRQRFENFERSFLLFQDIVQNIVERAGLIQFFEMTFELAGKFSKTIWKLTALR